MADIHTRHVGTAVVAGPPFSRISWGAIIAGTVCAFALQLVLNMIGLAAGLAAIDPGQDRETLSGIATGTGIWWGVSALIALFAGGWVAARLSGVPIRITAALHGVSVWALSVLLAVWLATSAVTSLASGVVGAVSQVGQVAATALGGSEDGGGAIDLSGLRTNERLQAVGDDIRSEARQIYRQVVSPEQEEQAGEAVQSTARDVARSPGDIGQDLNLLIDRLFASDGVFGEEDRQEAVEAIANRLGVSEQEAERIVDNWQERYQEALQGLEESATELRQAAAEAAERTTEVVAEASMWTAIALILGFVAALIGGIVGKPEPWAVEAADEMR